MYTIEYCEKEKDLTYDDALYSSLNNENNKWSQYYAYLKEKYDLCYNVKSITIDMEDIRKMKFECFSNDILLKLYLICSKNNKMDKYQQVTIENNSVFNEELIFNIFKAEWIISDYLINNDNDELLRRKNYFQAMIDVSDDSKDIKKQFRNKLYEYFIETYDNLKNNKEIVYEDKKVLKLIKK